MLLAAQAGDIEVWASTLVISECLAIDKDDLNVPQEVQAMFRALLTGGHPVKLAAVDVFIAERARSLRWVDQIKCGGGADMIHIATALELRCQEFITTNKKRGPLNAACVAKIATFGLRIIEAPQTSLIPAHMPLSEFRNRINRELQAERIHRCQPGIGGRTYRVLVWRLT